MNQPTMKAILVACLLLLAAPALARAQSPGTQETLRQYVADLQKNPSDIALRERIIKLVQTMNPAPAIPEEARRYFIEGNAMLKAAKDQQGYGLAIDTYRQCLLLAPWWAEAYNNYAVALDLTDQLDEAVTALKLYIATSPGEGEARKAQDKIYEIGAKKKLAAAKEQPASAQKQNAPVDIRSLEGAEYVGGSGYEHKLRIEGSRFSFWSRLVPASLEWIPQGVLQIVGRTAKRSIPDGRFEWTISDDGTFVTERRYDPRGREVGSEFGYPLILYRK